MVFDDVTPLGMKQQTRVSEIASCRPSECSSTARRPAGRTSTTQWSVHAHDVRPLQGNRTPCVGHLSGGEIFAVGYVDSAAGIDRSTIVGGTGAYAGAHGTISGSSDGAVITLEN